MSAIWPAGNWASSPEQRPATAPGSGPFSSDAQSGRNSIHGATSCVPSTTCGTRRNDRCRGEERLRAFALPHDVQDRVVIGGVGVMAMRVPIGGAQVDLDVADGCLAILFSIPAKPHHRPREIGPPTMIPESGLNDLYRAPVVRLQFPLIKLLEPKRLYLEFGRRVSGLLAHGLGWTVGEINRASFHFW